MYVCMYVCMYVYYNEIYTSYCINTFSVIEGDMTEKKRDNKYLGSAKQRLALHILNNKVEKSTGLVPEHIENRTLYNPAHPGISQVSHWKDKLVNRTEKEK